jgi:hypothetical protein
MPDTDDLFQFQRLDNGIYEFILLQGSRATVDAWLAKVVELNREARPQETVSYLLDTSRVDMPVAYTLLQAQEFVRRNPNRPPTRTLVLYRAGAPQIILLNIFTRWFSGKSRERAHFLPVSRRAEGIAWLLRED